MSPEKIVREALERLRDEHGIVVRLVEASWMDCSTISGKDAALSSVEIDAKIIPPTLRAPGR